MSSWLSALIVGHAYAQTQGFTVSLPLLGGKSRTYTSFNAYFSDLVGLVILVAEGFSVLIFIYAGFLYSQSQGDPKKISEAKEWVIGTLTGLAILLLIKLILPTLNINFS